MDLVLRASEFGFPSFLRRTNVLPDSLVFDIPAKQLNAPNIKIEFHIPTYVKKLIHLAKVKLRRVQANTEPAASLKQIWIESVRPEGFLKLIHTSALRFLMYDKEALMSDDQKARRSILDTPLIRDYLFNDSSTQNIPLALLAMSGWRGLFWTAVSQMPNFYNAVPGASGPPHETSVAAPARLDELSSTFLFHLCAELRRDKSTLPTDIPAGFCPNPCSTSPCLTLPHTVGQQCHLVGRGLFMSDFRCECLPGFVWVSGGVADEDAGGKEEEAEEDNTDEGPRTPMSDDVGSCVAVDICETYCSAQGTRRCDILPHTGSAKCSCKVSGLR
uniref:EGF-like domain-containing protein n=1 Tax=Mesocestoides corti TaxID=53468 RepID=A0A5K3FB47_MESCO